MKKSIDGVYDFSDEELQEFFSISSKKPKASAIEVKKNIKEKPKDKKTNKEADYNNARAIYNNYACGNSQKRNFQFGSLNDTMINFEEPSYAYNYPKAKAKYKKDKTGSKNSKGLSNKQKSSNLDNSMHESFFQASSNRNYYFPSPNYFNLNNNFFNNFQSNQNFINHHNYYPPPYKPSSRGFDLNDTMIENGIDEININFNSFKSKKNNNLINYELEYNTVSISELDNTMINFNSQMPQRVASKASIYNKHIQRPFNNASEIQKINEIQDESASEDDIKTYKAKVAFKGEEKVKIPKTEVNNNQHKHNKYNSNNNRNDQEIISQFMDNQRDISPKNNIKNSGSFALNDTMMNDFIADSFQKQANKKSAKGKIGKKKGKDMDDTGNDISNSYVVKSNSKWNRQNIESPNEKNVNEQKKFNMQQIHHNDNHNNLNVNFNLTDSILDYSMIKNTKSNYSAINQGENPKQEKKNNNDSYFINDNCSNNKKENKQIDKNLDELQSKHNINISTVSNNNFNNEEEKERLAKSGVSKKPFLEDEKDSSQINKSTTNNNNSYIKLDKSKNNSKNISHLFSKAKESFDFESNKKDNINYEKQSFNKNSSYSDSESLDEFFINSCKRPLKQGKKDTLITEERQPKLIDTDEQNQQHQNKNSKISATETTNKNTNDSIRNSNSDLEI